MSEAYISEIRLFAGNFAPRGWAFCDGQLMPISSNQALFSLLGNIYGGDGRTTFALPDLRGRVPVHFGQGAGLQDRPLGAHYGQETVSLTLAEMPTHTHLMMASETEATLDAPQDAVLAKEPQTVQDTEIYVGFTEGRAEQLNQRTIEPSGSGQPHANMMPYLAINFIIALVGIFPSRN